MKVKDLLDFNPEAEIKVIMPTGLPYDGKLDWGWECDDDCESGVNTKLLTKEIDIFLGNFKEHIDNES